MLNTEINSAQVLVQHLLSATAEYRFAKQTVDPETSSGMTKLLKCLYVKMISGFINS